MQFVSGIAVLDFAETGITNGFAVVFGKQETGFFHIVVGVPLPVKGAVRKVDADFNVGGVKKAGRSRNFPDRFRIPGIQFVSERKNNYTPFITDKPSQR